MKNIPYLFLAFVFLLSAGCGGGNTGKEEKKRLSREQLAEINRQLLIKDRERIISYIERKGLQMRETETGLWISEDVGKQGGIKEGDKVILEYTCSLLDGTLVYDSENDGLMSFTVGKSDIPSGLNEAVQLLGEGSEAVIIIPGYLGYGLVGDEKRIPARSILVYEVKVKGLN